MKKCIILSDYVDSRWEMRYPGRIMWRMTHPSLGTSRASHKVSLPPQVLPHLLYTLPSSLTNPDQFTTQSYENEVSLTVVETTAQALDEASLFLTVSVLCRST